MCAYIFIYIVYIIYNAIAEVFEIFQNDGRKQARATKYKTIKEYAKLTYFSQYFVS